MRKWIIALIVLAVTAFIGYNYIYQDHREIATEKAAFEITSETILSEFISNQKDAEDKYLNQTVEISGTISDITSNSITLDDKVFCQFNSNHAYELKPDKKIKIKGRVIGFDDLLEQVKLDQSILN